MMTPSGSSLSQFVDAYHLWDFVVLFVVLGAFHLLTTANWQVFRFLGEVNEACYNFRMRCVENRRRYEQVAQEGPGRAIARRAGAD